MTPCAQCFSHALCPNVAATVSNVIRCGFYFFPYASSEAIAAQLEVRPRSETFRDAHSLLGGISLSPAISSASPRLLIWAVGTLCPGRSTTPPTSTSLGRPRRTSPTRISSRVSTTPCSRRDTPSATNIPKQTRAPTVALLAAPTLALLARPTGRHPHQRQVLHDVREVWPDRAIRRAVCKPRRFSRRRQQCLLMPRAANRWANAPKLETPSFAQLNECEDERWSSAEGGWPLERANCEQVREEAPPEPAEGARHDHQGAIQVERLGGDCGQVSLTPPVGE